MQRDWGRWLGALGAINFIGCGAAVWLLYIGGGDGFGSGRAQGGLVLGGIAVLMLIGRVSGFKGVSTGVILVALVSLIVGVVTFAEAYNNLGSVIGMVWLLGGVVSLALGVADKVATSRQA